jgi:putative acetyltransferase
MSPPHPVTIRRQDGPAELAAVKAVTVDAFGAGDAVVADLVEALQGCDAFDGMSYVAVADGAIVGHVMLTRGWLDAPQALVDVLVLSPLSVRRDHQGRGVGGGLVRHALDEAWAADAVAVFLEGDPGFYSRLGFVPATPCGFERPSVRIPEAAFQVVLGPTYQRWMTGRLVYSDRFWAMDCVGLR